MTLEEITDLFFPDLVKARQPIKDGKRLVHYTSAECAYKILLNKQIWLRNSQMMNDFSEIRHGIECLKAGWHSDAGLALRAMLDRIFPQFSNDFVNHFDNHTDSFREQTFITSLSEHEDDEDLYGRLSMWRAYGNSTGIALVLNPTVFAGDSNIMQVFSSPVSYLDIDQFVDWFGIWIGKILANESKLKNLPNDYLKDILFNVFRTLILCTKHPGFKEEKEWRVFYSPFIEGQSDWIEPSVEVIGGIPQHIMKLNLFDKPEDDLIGIAPNTLLNRLIIGPCQYPLQVRTAMADAMQKAGVDDIQKKIWMSLIPLRDK